MKNNLFPPNKNLLNNHIKRHQHEANQMFTEYLRMSNDNRDWAHLNMFNLVSMAVDLELIIDNLVSKK